MAINHCCVGLTAQLCRTSRLQRILTGAGQSRQDTLRHITPQELVDAHIFVEAQKVLDALRAHDCGPALAWCGQHAGKLRKIRSHSLEFKLRLQVHLGRACPDVTQYARLT